MQRGSRILPRMPADFAALEAAVLRRNDHLDHLREGVSITDPGQPDNPLVYVNDAFLELTGYSRAEVLGRNCRFLQAPETDAEELGRVGAAVRDGRPVTVELLNARKDGATFWNRLTVSPLRDAAGRLTHFIAIQRDVTYYRALEAGIERRDAELSALREAVDLLRGRVREQEEAIAAYIMRDA